MVTDTTWRPFDIVYRNLGKYDEVILDGETVKDNEKFQLKTKAQEKENMQYVKTKKGN